MQVKESLLEETLLSKDIMDEEDEEETLSLCDLPLYTADNSYAEWGEDLFTEPQGSNSPSSDNHHDDYFEFSPQLDPSTTTTATATSPPESIIFCGKVIPYKEPDSSQLVDVKKKTNTKNDSWRLFRWNKEQKDASSKRRVNKRRETKDFPMHKVSILTSSSSGKSRWYLLFFGSSRFSTGIEWADIKSRQSRSSPLIRFQSDVDVNGARNKGCRLWWLIGALSCGGNHHPLNCHGGSTVL